MKSFLDIIEENGRGGMQSNAIVGEVKKWRLKGIISTLRLSENIDYVLICKYNIKY